MCAYENNNQDHRLPGGKLHLQHEFQKKLMSKWCLFYTYKFKHWNYLTRQLKTGSEYSGKPPNCITSICKSFNRIKEPTLKCILIKNSVRRQVFSRDDQNHIMS